jgi:tRNA/rRNA methyltransferase
MRKGEKGKGMASKSKNILSSERFRIILVEPEYEINIGAVARAMKNFCFSDLAFVSPKCNPRGFDAIKYSKHARDLLESARTYQSLSQATRGCKFAVGTTGVLYRHWNETFRTPMSLRELKGKLKETNEGKIALVFGNEGIGLSEAHISACDLIITIPTSGAYPILNLSHAVAIVLYELSELNIGPFLPAGENEKERLVESFEFLVGRFAPIMRNPKKVKVAFRRMVGKAMLSDKECASILGVMRRTNREIDKKKK